MKLRFLFLSVLVLFAVVFIFPLKASSDELDDLQKQINDYTTALNQSKTATAPLETQLTGIKNRVAFIENDVANKKVEIDKGYTNLAKQQVLLNRSIRNFYIKSYYNSPIITFLSASSADKITEILAYQRAVTDQDKTVITNIALTIRDLEQRKTDLEDEQARLAVVKTSLDKIVTDAKTYQATLTTKIAALSAKQQEILAQRLASLNIPLYASSLGSCSSDIGKDPGFSPKFGFYTYGVPNRIGLNQYGAFGRAKTGQGYEDILKAYYNYDSLEKKDATINVDGNGSFSLDDYVKRIYEVPNDWGDQGGMNALRAQAIAARSYAMAYTNSGAGSICTTQQCQVFQPNPKGGNWEQAVNDTAGQVMIKDGQPVKAWFSSTHGGYVFNSGDIGWSGTSFTKNTVDTTSGSASNFSDVQNNSYDKDSPWFYCDWGSRSDYNKTAWLKSEEVADIVNIILLLQKDSGISSHLYQVDRPNPAGTDTWGADRVKQELKNRGGTPFNSISNASVNADFGKGVTTGISFSGDGGSVSFSADLFVTYFDLRAPVNIYIPQLGKNGDGSLKSPLFNVEQ